MMKSVMSFVVATLLTAIAGAANIQPKFVCMFDTTEIMQVKPNVGDKFLENAARLLIFEDVTSKTQVAAASFDTTQPDGYDAGGTIRQPFKAMYPDSFTWDSTGLCCAGNDCKQATTPDALPSVNIQISTDQTSAFLTFATLPNQKISGECLPCASIKGNPHAENACFKQWIAPTHICK